MGLLTVAANGQSLTVDLHRPGGSRPSTFSDAGLTTPITLPLAITADQDFYFRSGTNIVTVTVTTAAGVTLLSSVQHEVGDTDHVVVTPLPTAAQEAATDSAASGGSSTGVSTWHSVTLTSASGDYVAGFPVFALSAGDIVEDIVPVPVTDFDNALAPPVALGYSLGIGYNTDPFPGMYVILPLNAVADSADAVADYGTGGDSLSSVLAGAALTTGTDTLPVTYPGRFQWVIKADTHLYIQASAGSAPTVGEMKLLVKVASGLTFP